MDGVLFDTEPMYTEVGVRLLQRRGREFSPELKREMMGRPGPDAVQIMIDREGLQDAWPALLAEAEREFMQIAASSPLLLLPGLQLLFAELQAHAIPFGVATSSRKEVAEVLLRRVSLRDDLAFLLTGDLIEKGKPHPEIYQRAAEEMGIAPDEMLVVEDSPNGCAAGVASGACVIAISGEQDLDQGFHGVAAIVSRLDDPRLLGLFGTALTSEDFRLGAKGPVQPLPGLET